VRGFAGSPNGDEADPTGRYLRPGEKPPICDTRRSGGGSTHPGSDPVEETVVPVISVPQAFNEDDLYVDLRSIFGHSLFLKCEGFNFAGSIKLSYLSVTDPPYWVTRSSGQLAVGRCGTSSLVVTCRRPDPEVLVVDARRSGNSTTHRASTPSD
jgi:hypothetical protein